MKYALILAASVPVGTAVVLVTNWVLTGLPEITPMRSFWVIADHRKVEEIFGIGGIEYFMAVRNDMGQKIRWYRSVLDTLRFPMPRLVVWLSLIGLVMVAVRTFRRYRATGTVAGPDKFLGQLVAFLVPLVACALVWPSPSIHRMGVYSVVFIILGMVVLWQRLVDIGVGIRLRYLVTTALIVCGVVVVFAEAKGNIARDRRLIVRYAIGAKSLKETMRAMESRDENAPGTSVTALSDFRERVGGGGRILSLVFDPGYAYLLPGSGIVSEPTYALVRNPDELLASNPLKVAEYLRQRNVQYFSVNLQSKLFTTIAFTSLFDPLEMSKYFTVIYVDGDLLILSWRQSEADELLPDYLLTGMDLKRAGVLHYPFTKDFARSTSGGYQSIVSVAGHQRAKTKFLEEVDTVVTTQMLPLVALSESRIQILRIVEAGKAKVESADVGQFQKVRRGVSGDMRIVETIPERELARRFLSMFRDAIAKEYITEFGAQLAALSLKCDERYPFSKRYPPGATCS